MCTYVHMYVHNYVCIIITYVGGSKSVPDDIDAWKPLYWITSYIDNMHICM